MSEKDGGPAFPQFKRAYDYQSTTIPGQPFTHGGGLGDSVTASTTVTGGMSLRDWFASQALSGMRIDYWEIDGGGSDPASPARAAYAIADAMLKAREVKS